MATAALVGTLWNAPSGITRGQLGRLMYRAD